MNINQQRYKLSYLNNQQKKTERDLENKKESLIESLPLDERIVNTISVYDSDWLLCDVEKIDDATSQTYEELLPEKAKYSFSQVLNIPEQKLPFLNINVITQTNPDQVIQGVGEFIYTSLRELTFNLYDWKGVTAVYLGNTTESYGTSEGDTKPPITLPDPTTFGETPAPESLYSGGSRFYTITLPYLGSGLGPYDLSADGTQVYAGGEWIDYADWNTAIGDVWGYDASANVDIGAEWIFLPGANDFPVPVGEDPSYVLPGGSTTDPETHSTANYPNQYWEIGDATDFAGLVVLYGYEDAKDIIEEYYIDVIISDDAPYKAYETIYTDTVETAEQHKTITELPDGSFQIKISGHLLLLSKAITETSFSDPLSPTYEPNGGDMYVRLVITYNIPVNYNEHEEYSR